MTQPDPTPTAPPPGDLAPAPTDPPTPPPAPADDLGEAGKRALATEREARKAAEKELARFRKAEQDKVDADKSEAEKRTAAEERAVKAELRVTVLEVVAEKGLTPAQAKYLTGATRAELEANAEQLLVDFPAAPAGPPGPRVPAPDPSQGPRGGQPAADIDARIAEAQRDGDWQTAIALKRQKNFQ